jgi:hypothetical protein
MGYFLDYLKIDQTNPEECFEVLIQKARANSNWFVNAVFKYLQKHLGNEVAALRSNIFQLLKLKKRYQVDIVQKRQIISNLDQQLNQKINALEEKLSKNDSIRIGL